MTTSDDQPAIRSFVRDLVTATVKQADLPGSSFPLLKWTELAISQKLSRDLPSVYARGSETDPNFVLDVRTGSGEAVSLWLPRIRTVVNWRTASASQIAVYRASGVTAPHAEGLLDRVRPDLPAQSSFTVYIPRDSNRITDILVVPGEKGSDDSKRLFVRDLVTMTVGRQSARDTQSLPGPSDLANPCDLCVASKIARSMGISTESLNGNGSGSFSLKAWMGTAIHEKLERDLPRVYARGDRMDPNFHQEVTVRISEITGLGTIHGHVDLLLPKRALVVDWKTADLHRIHKYKTSGVPATHAGQIMLYLRGLRNSGKRADTAVLVYIPRDSSRISDVWVASCSYQDGIATGLLNRAQNLVEVVRSGQTGNLASDPDCYVCHVQHRIRH